MTVFSAIRETAGYFGERAVANPGMAGGATALFIAMTFFTANAIYFQEQQHPSALFATRPDLAENLLPPAAPKLPVNRIVAASQEPATTRFAAGEPAVSASPAIPAIAPVPLRRPSTEVATAPQDEGDRSTAGVQELLAKLGYYDGDIDGLKGPMTDAAIETYKQKTGLRGIELTEAELMTSLRNNLGVTAAIPEPRPEPVKQDVSQMVAELIATATDGTAPLPASIPSAEVVKVQAALRAFGNTEIEVDGITGARTEAAIREFQALFHLPVTGEIDGTLLDKMRAVGLIH